MLITLLYPSVHVSYRRSGKRRAQNLLENHKVRMLKEYKHIGSGSMMNYTSVFLGLRFLEQMVSLTSHTNDRLLVETVWSLQAQK